MFAVFKGQMGQTIFVNPHLVRALASHGPTEDQTQIAFSNDHSVFVLGAPHDVAVVLERAMIARD